MNTPTTRAEPPTKSAVKRKMKDSSVIDIINLPDNIQLTKKILKTNVCRLCATYHESGPNLLPLFETYKGVIILSKIVNSLMVIEVVKNDGLPEVICKKCTDQLIAWYKMRITSIEVNRALEIEAQTLGSPDAVNSNNMRLLLSETIQNILAVYSLNIDSVIVCQLCDTRTVNEEFVRHLEAKHAAVRDREALEIFIQEHVTFEEALVSDPDSDAASATPRAASPEAERLPQQHAEGALDGVTRGLFGDESQATEHLSDDRANPETGSGGLETNQKRIPAVCPHCNRLCSNKYNMLVHMKSHAEGHSAKFDCECGKSYSTRGNLAAHRRAAHERVLPHVCEACGRGFPTRGARDVHARRHSGARPFVCGACGLAFRAASALRQHARTHAPRALACALCGKRFLRRAHLRYHVGTHRHQAPTCEARP